MKHYIWFALAALIIIGGTPIAQDDESLRFEAASFNIRYGTAEDGENSWVNRDQILLDYLRQNRFDLLGLQEALKFQIEDILEALPAYRFVGVGRDDGRSAGEFSPILYRFDRFKVLDSGTFWFSDTPQVAGSTSWGNSITRICTWADFEERETKTRFRMFNTHFDHRSQYSREESARLLVRRIVDTTHPVIVTGDLNAGEENPAVLILKQGGLDAMHKEPILRDTFRVLHPEAEKVGTFNAFQGRMTGEKIDYLLVSGEFEVIAAEVDHFSRAGRYPSDHFPVWAEVRLASPSTSPRSLE